MSLYNLAWLAIVLVIVLTPVSLLFGAEVKMVAVVELLEIVFLTILGVLKNE